MASDTFLTSVVTVFPPASCITTVTGGAIVAPPAAPEGCTPNASFAAVPTVMFNGLLTITPGVVDTVLPVAVSVYPFPSLSIDRFVNTACPVAVFTATGFVPESAPPGPALVCIANVMLCATPVTVFPPAS